MKSLNIRTYLITMFSIIYMHFTGKHTNKISKMKKFPTNKLSPILPVI